MSPLSLSTSPRLRGLALLALLGACDPSKIDFPDDCDATAWYPDMDGDGHGDATGEVDACEAPEGYVEDYTDCDDTDADVIVCRRSGETPLAEAAGAALIGEEAGDWAGYAVAHAGDVNGDGVGDALVATGRTNGGEGGVYLVQGPLSGERDLSTADAVLRQMDARESDNVIYNLVGAGDLDDDGYADVAAADYMEPDGLSGEGALWMFEGPLSGTSDLEDASVVLRGDERFAAVGLDRPVFGDVDGDGQRDVVVSSFGARSRDEPGGALVFLGPRSGEFTVEDADFSVLGIDPDDQVGSGVALGDLDGDGVDDLALGARYTAVAGHAQAGALYTWTGPLDGDLDIEDADGQVLGSVASAQLGDELRIAGDMDGDGTADLLATAPYDGTTPENVGALYVFAGPLEGTGTSDDASARLGGANEGPFYYAHFAAADMDLDGYGDVAVGTSASSYGYGSLRLTYGPMDGRIDLDDGGVDATFDGDDRTAGGIWDVSMGGDLSGDVWPDLLVGAITSLGGSSEEAQAGRALVLFGGP